MSSQKTHKDHVDANLRRSYIAFASKSMELCFQVDKPWRKFDFGWHYYNFGWPELMINLGCFTLFFSWMRGFNNNKFDENGNYKQSHED